MIIRDAETQKSAQVDDDKRLSSYAAVRTQAEYINNVDEEMYSQSFTYTTAGAHTFYFLENDSNTKNLHVVGLKVQSTAADSFQVLLGTTGTPAGGAAITPVNLKAGSGKAADCTSYGDAEVTGLTDGSEVDQIFSVAAGISEYHPFPGELILQSNRAMSLKSSAAETWNVTVYFYFKEF